jgi:hypothetical protein
MNRRDAMPWIVSVCAITLRLSQAKTLSQLVGAAMVCQRISLAAIGRSLVGTAKHQIKKVYRFCANDRIETADAMVGIVKRVWASTKQRPLVIALDWTDIKGYQSLVAALVLKGRAVPLCWASCRKDTYEGHRSRNAFEESLLLVLKAMLPAGRRVILIADRGFGRTELARFCQHHGFDYIIRINPDVHVQGTSYTGKLIDYPVHKGLCRFLRNLAYRSHHPVFQNVVVRWVRGLAERRDECWFLMTNLIGGPARISNLYGQRMAIEEFFRDLKNKRNGWSLRDTQITKADRLLLILAIAYILVCGVGLQAQKTCGPAAWNAASKNQCSMFCIGLLMLAKIPCSHAQAFRRVLTAAQNAAPKWG